MWTGFKLLWGPVAGCYENGRFLASSVTIHSQDAQNMGILQFISRNLGYGCFHFKYHSM
jgi:hypothetical protein